MHVNILHGEELTYSYGKGEWHSFISIWFAFLVYEISNFWIDLRKTINQQFYREGVAPWHQELCIAQNNLYVKELFAQVNFKLTHKSTITTLQWSSHNHGNPTNQGSHTFIYSYVSYFNDPITPMEITPLKSHSCISSYHISIIISHSWMACMPKEMSL